MERWVWTNKRRCHLGKNLLTWPNYFCQTIEPDVIFSRNGLVCPSVGTSSVSYLELLLSGPDEIGTARSIHKYITIYKPFSVILSARSFHSLYNCLQRHPCCFCCCSLPRPSPRSEVDGRAWQKTATVNCLYTLYKIDIESLYTMYRSISRWIFVVGCRNWNRPLLRSHNDHCQQAKSLHTSLTLVGIYHQEVCRF